MGGVGYMSESEGGEAPVEIDTDAVLRIAADRLVWIRLLEKAVNDIDGIMVGLKNDIAEISSSMMARDGVIPQEEVIPDDEQE